MSTKKSPVKKPKAQAPKPEEPQPQETPSTEVQPEPESPQPRPKTVEPKLSDIKLILDALTDLPPAFIWGNMIFCILCSVSILRYHLLDIRVVARTSLVYLIISSVLAVPYLIIFNILIVQLNINSPFT